MFAVVHLYTEQIEDIGKLTSENKKQYAKKHGYKFLEFNKLDGLDLSKNVDNSKFLPSFYISIGWAKIPLLKKILLENKEIEWFFWIDADAIFMNYNIKLENLISRKAFFIVGRFCNGINVGTFFIRNCQKSLDFLDDVWENGPEQTDTWWTETEQGQIDLVSQREKYFDGFWTVPNNQFNSILNNCQESTGGTLPCSVYKSGDFIIHLPGLRNKFETLSSCLNYVIK